MALGSNQMTITTGDVFIPEIWTKEVQVATESTFVLANLVKRMDSEAKDGGDTLHTPKVSNISAYAKAANTQVTLNSPTETEFTLALNRHFESSYLVEDRLKIQSKYDVLNQYVPMAGRAISKKIDTDLAGLYASISQYVGNSTTDIDDANLRRAIQFLDDADAPVTERYFVIKPSGLNHLRGVSKFMQYDALGINGVSPIVSGGLPNGSSATSGVAKNGFVGRLYGVDIFVSTNLIEEAGTSDVVHNMLFHKEAFVLAMQQEPRTQFQYKQEYLGTLATVDALWGYGVFRSTFAVDVRSDDENIV